VINQRVRFSQTKESICNPILTLARLLLVSLLMGVVVAAEEEVDSKPAVVITVDELGKHNLTNLNKRAGADAMGGVAYTDYEDPCIYCHEPTHGDMKLKDDPRRIPNWNRLKPATENYEIYRSNTLDSKTTRNISEISMLCLSCHDGSMAVDRIVFKPRAWDNEEDAALHMRINASSDLRSCGKCHDGEVAHDISVKELGTDLRNDHPISIRYLGIDQDVRGFRSPDSGLGFDNGIKLYDGKIECATCHDIHDPEANMLLRTDSEQLCTTCHLR